MLITARTCSVGEGNGDRQARKVLNKLEDKQKDRHFFSIVLAQESEKSIKRRAILLDIATRRRTALPQECHRQTKGFNNQMKKHFLS
ncbi:hypothetical protein TNCV_2722731 [Trichonephila clavipes]|nr:hypothetical protein TNCV_2722731 [Trichonephila clavipes]